MIRSIETIKLQVFVIIYLFAYVCEGSFSPLLFSGNFRQVGKTVRCKRRNV